tara:strand:- start:305 stop:478 length:174 start_codon:yes stop_codon:yes gene_type:complete
MKMKDIIKKTEHRFWKTDYLNTDVKVIKKRKEYCKQQTLLGRKDTFKIYEEARRKFK